MPRIRRDLRVGLLAIERKEVALIRLFASTSQIRAIASQERDVPGIRSDLCVGLLAIECKEIAENRLFASTGPL